MLTETDFSQIQDYLLKNLPQWLRQSPDIATTIEGIVAQQFPRRDDFAKLLEEMKSLRQEVSWRLELQSQEIHDHRKEMEQRLESLRQETEQRIESVRQEVIQRIDLLREDMERRFEQVDKRFEQMDKRLEQVDKRLEQVDKHLEQVDKHLEQVDKHLEQVDQQLADLKNDNLQIKRKIVKLQAGQDNIIKRLDGQEAWLRMTIGSLHNDKGETLEDMFAAGLRYGLKDEEITAETIRLREPLVDHDGLVFEKGYETEVDLVAHNGQLTVFEVKATAKSGDVDFFAWKVQLMQAQNPSLQVRGVFICLGALPAVKQRCLERRLRLLS